MAELSELRLLLKKAGLRATGPRLAVLEHLVTSGAPKSHGEVAEQLLALGLDRATVYRNLMDLTEAGLAVRSDMGDHVWRFEFITQAGQHANSAHPHFICGGCGSVVCLPTDTVRIQNARGVPRALKRQGLTIQLRGICDACA